MKAFTDISQGKKLAEILPVKSADMYYHNRVDIPDNFPLPIEWKRGLPLLSQEIPCWSLAALLSVTRNYCTRFELTLRSNKKYNLFAMTDNYVYRGFNEYPDGIDEPIDVCVALIEKLHKFKTL